MNNNKNMTIDDLAMIVKEEFEKVNEKFDKIDEKFDKIDEKFDKIDKRFDIVDRNIDEIKMKMAYVAWQIDMNDVKERLAEVEKKVGIKK